MKRVTAALLIVVGALLLVVIAAGTVFYVKVYRPIGSPLMAMAGGRTLEDRRLRNHATFLPPLSAELSADQITRFVAVEEKVERRLADGIAILERNRADLERASATQALSTPAVLRAFGDIKGIYLDAKVVQIDAMNRANFSKAEFEWVRKRLYSDAGLQWAQLDVSEVLAGTPDATVAVHLFEAEGQTAAHDRHLALWNATTLKTWATLGFFGL
jgi:hypothetical protein